MTQWTIFQLQVTSAKTQKLKNFDKAAIARFGIIIKHSERRGNETVTVSSILSLETWVKKEDTATLELLKKGKEVTVEGFFKPESYTKDGKNVTVLRTLPQRLRLLSGIKNKTVLKRRRRKRRLKQPYLEQGDPWRRVSLFFACRLSVWTLPGFSVGLILFPCKHAFLNPLMPFFECHMASNQA